MIVPGTSPRISSHSSCSFFNVPTRPEISLSALTSIKRFCVPPVRLISLGMVTIKSGTPRSTHSREFLKISRRFWVSLAMWENLNLFLVVRLASASSSRMFRRNVATMELSQFSHWIFFVIILTWLWRLWIGLSKSNFSCRLGSRYGWKPRGCGSRTLPFFLLLPLAFPCMCSLVGTRTLSW